MATIQFKIDEYSNTPKYKQIINSVVFAIENENLLLHDKLPSINEVSIAHDVSRDTVEKAYRELKKQGVIDSVPGKGYYIKSTHYRQKRKIFLLFNKLSAHKKIIYDSFIKTLGNDVAVDFFVYHNNFRIFRDLILSHKENYTNFVIISHFYTGEEKAKEIINQLPKHKLLILDKKIEGITGEYAAIYQNFEKDIYNALTEAKHLIKKYNSLKIIFPPQTYHAREILKGFQKFCIENVVSGKIVPDIGKASIAAGEAYITLMEDDLVTLIKKTKQQQLKVGRDLGIISYNENPLKEILLDGITVMSTDFERMGEQAARIILENDKQHYENPFRLILRESL